MYYIAKKNGKTFRVSDVQAKAFKNAGYTLTEEKAKAAKAKTTKAKAEAAEAAEAAE
ncbi:MAG: hypothetical protein LUH48_09345 [Clostridiales bacterium]|nr:hypothetical protein [Clostridiales bacterium]